MSDRASLSIDDLPAELRRRLNVRRAPRRTMTADRMRGHALDVLAQLSNLSQRDRARVLRHALKVNAV